METIKVNMNPNPLDVQTIHASQNDGEARQWGFKLHNNGDVIDSSEVTDQMVFKAYKGGTEQLLPENTSTPVTSPFKGDIRYPQGLLTDQEFTYRQSPTEEDGLAKITDIKGNTLVWNQLVPMDWVSTITFSDGLSVTNNNDGSYTINGTASQSRFPPRNTEIYGIQGHKYLIQVLSSQNKAVISQNGSSVYVRDKTIYTAQNNNAFIIYFNVNTYNNEKIIPMIIDLTQMFGSGNEPTTVDDFTSLFPLSYYAYNQGSLLSFMGNGIKTVGKNLCTRTIQSNIYNAGNLIPVKSGDVIHYGGVWTGTGSMWGAVYASKDETNKNNYLQEHNWIMSGEITSVTIIRDGYFGIAFGAAVSSYNVEKMMISFAPFTFDEYEPYTSSTLSLPISTYFPTGMKSAGTVYDELTPRKAITRIGMVDLGTLNWAMNVTSLFSAQLVGLTTAQKEKVKSAIYQLGVTNFSWSSVDSYADKSISTSTNNYIYIKNTSYTDATAFTQAMSGVYLYYELATPTETSFTTASLVTENAEIPLSNNDGVLIGKCTEQLSENPGFIDAKIKLSDSDGTCYSNKIQLHVERSPQ